MDTSWLKQWNPAVSPAVWAEKRDFYSQT
jgi:hypothetical protein